MADFVPRYEATEWYGIVVPKNTPANIVEKLNKHIDVALADSSIKARFADLGGVAMPTAPADFGNLISRETEKWGKVIRAANIKAQ